MVESTLEGDLNVEGAKARTRRLPQRVHRDPTSIRIAGDAPADKLREVVERGTDRSVVFDSISAGVPISVDVTPSDRKAKPGTGERDRRRGRELIAASGTDWLATAGDPTAKGRVRRQAR